LNLFIRISFLFFSLSLFPQLVSLDEVTVSESKISLPFSQKYRSIEIISSEAIIESGARNIIDILQQVSGVDIRRRGSAGTQADLYIRGGGFDQTLLLIDGMKMDDIQTGHHTLNLLLPIHLVERIEIIKGPAARIFGQNAFNGAINIVTKKIIEDDDNQFEVFLGDVSYGSYEKFNFSINSKLTIKDNYSSLFTYSRNKSNGYRYNTDFSNEFLFFKSEIKTSKNPINILSGFTEKNLVQMVSMQVPLRLINMKKLNQVFLELQAYYREIIYYSNQKYIGEEVKMNIYTLEITHQFIETYIFLIKFILISILLNFLNRVILISD